jgi:DNA mismatch repair protein MutL
VKKWSFCLGFEIDPIGDTQLLVRAIPALWGNYALPERLANLWSRVAVSEPTQNLAWDEVLFETTAMRACRSAVKAGDVLSAWAAHELVAQMLACEHPWNCPHGRPTTVEIEETKLEEWFLRTVPS